MKQMTEDWRQVVLLLVSGFAVGLLAGMVMMTTVFAPAQPAAILQEAAAVKRVLKIAPDEFAVVICRLPTPTPQPTSTPAPTHTPTVTPTVTPTPQAVDLLWDHPEFGRGWVGVSSTVPVTWHLFIDVELRAPDGEVVASQVVTTGIRGQRMPLTGTFATVGWRWPVYPAGLEEWVRIRWEAEGREPIYGAFLGDDGVLAERDERGFSLRRTLGE